MVDYNVEMKSIDSLREFINVMNNEYSSKNVYSIKMKFNTNELNKLIRL